LRGCWPGNEGDRNKRSVRVLLICLAMNPAAELLKAFR
jgi:hypothetical protein